ncbi:hypothetical protein REC12_01210 [Desulfosporosinus sp. PR]|uniref:hypothetical protein n=1 Tax=Candidatus Desulfosporosinus nitrosoreducens TaxID=3401928 RepID=UPI0027F558B5|nr:hypothetical protein [Desulfosporosinus sp. PR]MDQ7092208.1 hypothetical protein [Desulfosporosinus sp. PR]
MNKKILVSIITFCLLLAGCAKGGTPQQIEKAPFAPGTTSKAAFSESTASTASATPIILSSLSSPAQLKSILAKYTKQQIVFFQLVALGNKQNAAFAIVNQGDVWYIIASGAQKLQSGIALSADNQFNSPYLWSVDDTKVFKYESSSGGSSSLSYAWYINDEKPVELPYTGMNLSYLGNGQFTTIGDSFDLNFTDGIGAGHTYKHYYLYWTPEGLKEYGGLKITQQQLLNVKGAQAIIEAITESGHIIDEIYYRANNLINLNYHSGDQNNGDFENLTLEYRNNTVTPELAYAGSNSSKTESFNESNLSDFSYGGIYQAALFSEIATYPDKFPLN